MGTKGVRPGIWPLLEVQYTSAQVHRCTLSLCSDTGWNWNLTGSSSDPFYTVIIFTEGIFLMVAPVF